MSAEAKEEEFDQLLRAAAILQLLWKYMERGIPEMMGRQLPRGPHGHEETEEIGR